MKRFTILFAALVLFILPVNLMAQQKGSVFFAVTAQVAFTKNRVVSGQPVVSDPASFYNAFKIGYCVSDRIGIAFEYSSFVYHWSNRSYLYDFGEDEWDFSSPTKGEKVNHYKVLLEVNPSKGLFLCAGLGYMDYQQFEFQFEDRGVVFNGGLTYLFTKVFGFSANIYLGNYMMHRESGNFRAISAGLVLRFQSGDYNTQGGDYEMQNP